MADGLAAGLLLVPGLVGVALAGGFVGLGLGVGVGLGVAPGDFVGVSVAAAEALGEAEALEVAHSVGDASGPADDGIGLPAESTSPKSNPSWSTT